MKRILLFTLLISLIGYSQNPKQPNNLNFNDGLPQDLVEKMNPLNLHLGVNDLDYNPIQRVSGMKPQSFQSEMNNQSDNENTYRLESESVLSYSWYFFWGQPQSFIPNRKQEINYDENGNRTLYINYSWSSESQSFVPYSKHEFTYDENVNIILWEYFRWNTESQSFYLSIYYETTYDENGNMILDLSYDWDTESQSFVPERKYEYNYDVNGNLILELIYIWSSESQSFIPYRKHETNYDENFNKTIEISYNWDTESQSFFPSSKREYTYDENGNIILSEYFNWFSESQGFVPSGKDEYTYDDNGNKTLYIIYYWDTTTQSFEPWEKYEYTYDDNGNKILEIYLEDYNFFNEGWDEGSKHEYTYDNNGNQSLVINYQWDYESQSFVLSNKRETSHDEYNFITIQTTYRWYLDLGVFKPVYKMSVSNISETETNLVREGTSYEYDTNFNTWNELEGEEFKSHWYYTKTSSLSSNSVEPNSFLIYPNPTSNSLQINSSESLSNPIFELYDVKGSKILSNPFKLTKPIDVSDLQPSMYIYNVKDGSELKQSGKVLIE